MPFVFLQYFENTAEAELASQVLATEDIDSVVKPEAIPGAGTLIQGAELWVNEEDVICAEKVIGKGV